MRLSILSTLKPIVLSIAAIAVMGLGQGIANADEVTFIGYTNGCFDCNPPPVPNSSAVQTNTLFGFMYVNSTFNDTTSLGQLGFGGNPVAPPTQNFNNFGGLQLLNSLANYNGHTFTLVITFTAPATIVGGNQTLYSATLVGNVSSTGTGGVRIDFDQTPRVFAFTNASASGVFTLVVDDVSINPGQVGEITGFITSASQSAIPEPASMLLLGTGLVGIAGAARRWKLKARK